MVSQVRPTNKNVQLWLALRCLKSQTRPLKVPKVGYVLFKEHIDMLAIKDQSDMDSEVSGAETEVADAEVASRVLPVRPGILSRHSSCPEDDDNTNRRAWFFFHLI